MHLIKLSDIRHYLNNIHNEARAIIRLSSICDKHSYNGSSPPNTYITIDYEILKLEVNINGIDYEEVDNNEIHVKKAEQIIKNIKFVD
jgi:hypothetical protein